MASRHDADDDGKESPTETDERATTSVSRRKLLKTTGAAAVLGAGLLGTSETASASPTTDDFQFDRELHAVDDLGMDPTGEESISATLEQNYRSNTKIVFPEGTYKITDMLVSSGGVSHFGMEGLGSSPSDVQFRPPSQSGGDRYRFAVIKGGGPHMWRNLSFQQRSDEYTSVSMRIITQGGTLFEDVEWLGKTPTDNNCRDELLSVSSDSQSGVTTCRRVVMGRDAAAVKPGYPNGVMGIRCEKSNNGEIRIEDCHIERLGSTAFRHAHSSGVLTVVGGFFKNNDLCQMRIAAGNHPDKVSTITGATSITTDVADATMALQFDNSRRQDAGAVIEDCEILYTVDESSRGVVTCPEWGDHGGFTLRNCRIRNDGSNLTLNVDNTSTSPDEVTIENCHFTGDGSGNFVVNGREGSVMRDSCFDMPNAEINGTISLENVSRDGCDGPDESRNSGDDSSTGSGDEDSSNGDDDKKNGNEVAVSTGSADNVGSETATLGGSLDGLGDGSSVDVSVEYRETGADAWESADSESLSETGSFASDVSDLSTATEYEFRAAATAGNDTVTGQTATFSTRDAAPDDARTLRIQGTGQSANYEFAVSGDLQAAPDADDLEQWDTIDGSNATGWVTAPEHVDTYRFTDDITDFTFHQNSAAVFVDGEEVDPDSLGSDDSDGSGDQSDGQSSSIRIEGTGESANYEFAVSDSLQADPEVDDLEPWDEIDGATAIGWVTAPEHVDTYRFTGDITDFTFRQNDAAVFVDGEEVDPDSLGSDGSDDSDESGDQSRSIRIEGTGESADYEFIVSGSLEADPGADNLESWDLIDGDSATGWVTDPDHIDTYRFTGDITDFTFHQNGAAVFVDGEEVDPDSL